MKNKRISALYPFKKMHRLITITVIIGFCLSNVQGKIDQGMWMTVGNSTFSTSDYSSLKLAIGTELGYMANGVAIHGFRVVLWLPAPSFLGDLPKSSIKNK